MLYLRSVLYVLYAHTCLSTRSTAPEQQPPPSDSEEEIDFGFWEKATSLPTLLSSDKTKSSTQQSRAKEVDLDLL